MFNKQQQKIKKEALLHASKQIITVYIYMFSSFYFNFTIQFHLIIRFWWRLMFKIISIAILLTLASSTEKAVNYNQEPYTALINFFGNGGVETSDQCGDKLKHITAKNDSILNKNVFVYTLHRHGTYEDSDRCAKFDRQRVQTSVTSHSQKWMQGKNGLQFSYAWKFYSEKDIHLSGYFCHIHQIKLDGAGMGNPSLTITLRKDHVDVDNKGKSLASCPIGEFVGNWIQFRQKITYGKNGCLTLTATRIHDGKVLLNHSGCGVDVDDAGGMIRPKFGFYRSLQGKQALRDQSVKLGDICIGQGDSCHFNEFGERYEPHLQSE